MAHLQMLYSEWLDQDLVERIQNKSPPIIFSLASYGFGGNLSQLFFVIFSPKKGKTFRKMQKQDFDQQTRCASSVDWLKYATVKA